MNTSHISFSKFHHRSNKIHIIIHNSRDAEPGRPPNIYIAQRMTKVSVLTLMMVLKAMMALELHKAGVAELRDEEVRARGGVLKCLSLWSFGQL